MFIHISEQFYKFLLRKYLFCIFFDKCWLRKVYAVLKAANRFVGSEIPKNKAFDLIDENFEN